MKKLIALLVLSTVALLAPAQNVGTLLSGQATNSTIYWGTNSAVVLNRLLTTQSLTASAGVSNLAYVVTNTTFYASGSTVGVVAGFFNSGLGTNTYTLQRAYDKTTGPWEAWTNVTLTSAAGAARGNFTLTIGDYHYFKVSDITNASPATCTSNRLSFHQK